MREFITVGPEHIGKFAIDAFGRTWMVANHFRTLHDYDLGKRIYLCSNDAGDYQYLQIEDEEQRDKRMQYELMLYMKNKGLMHGQDGVMYYPPQYWGYNLNAYNKVPLIPDTPAEESYRDGYKLGYRLQGHKYRTYYNSWDGKYY